MLANIIDLLDIPPNFELLIENIKNRIINCPKSRIKLGWQN